MIRRVPSGAPIVDSHERAPTVGVPAADEHDRLPTGDRGGQRVAPHGIHYDISLHDLRLHRVQVLVLKLRTVMGVA
jgi:hypothetical protein